MGSTQLALRFTAGSMLKRARPNDGRPIQHTRWVELIPVLHSTRTAVSASRESRLLSSTLHGERGSALFHASGV
jgi:hypothetical protein